MYDAVENDALVRAAADVGEGWREVSELRASPDVGQRGMAAGPQGDSVRPMSACPLLPGSHNDPCNVVNCFQKGRNKWQQAADALDASVLHTCNTMSNVDQTIVS